MKQMKLIALVAAVIAGLALYRFLDVISRPTEVPRTSVVVAAADIPENTTITADMVKLQPVATEALQKDCLTDLEQVVGMAASSDILSGEQVVSERLVKVGETDSSSDTLAYVVQPGMRAVTVAVDDTSGVGYLIKPGNRVDVVLNYTYTDAADKAVAVSRILMQDIQVLAVDRTLSREGSAAEEGYTTVTLMTKPAQAVELSYAEYSGSLRLILRSSLDTGTVSDGRVSSSQFQS
jgi:pilus assembly protein CpaB